MWIEVVGRGLKLTRAARDRIDRRLEFALGRLKERIGRITIRLIDVNGPRGGLDKRCHIVAELPGIGPAVVDVADYDLKAVIDRSADRIGQSVRRLISRRRSH